MRKYSRALVGLALAAGLLGSAMAQDAAERKRLAGAVQEVMRHPEARQAAIRAGRERTLLCSKCHGETGNSVSPEIPNLAGQNPAYLLQQIEKFADGRRKNFVMRSLARSFTFEDKVNLAIYFSSMEVEPRQADPVLADKGKQTFQSVCQTCHGTDGKGEKGYARLAGQRIEYVERTLKRFRANARKGTEDGAEMTRHDIRMEQVTKNLSDQEITALANYIALLK